MTKVIANILINEVMNTEGYDVEKKIMLIKEVEKMLIASIKMDREQEKAQKIVKNNTDEITENIPSINLSSNNKPVVTHPVVENKPVEHKPVENKPVVEEKPAENKPVVTSPVENKPVVEEKPAENKPVVTSPVENKPVVTHPVENKPVENKPVEQKKNNVPTRPTKTNNMHISNMEKTMSFKEKVASLAVLAEESKKPDNRSYEEKVKGMEGFFDPTDTDGKKAEKLMNKAKDLLGYDEYETMRNAFNKPETFQRLCNLWDYFHREIPNNWPERPNIED